MAGDDISPTLEEENPDCFKHSLFPNEQTCFKKILKFEHKKLNIELKSIKKYINEIIQIKHLQLDENQRADP